MDFYQKKCKVLLNGMVVWMAKTLAKVITIALKSFVYKLEIVSNVNKDNFYAAS